MFGRVRQAHQGRGKIVHCLSTCVKVVEAQARSKRRSSAFPLISILVVRAMLYVNKPFEAGDSQQRKIGLGLKSDERSEAKYFLHKRVLSCLQWPAGSRMNL